MTTTKPTACPGWCTRDHARDEARQRELAIKDDFAVEVIEADLARDRHTHSAATGGPVGYEVEVCFDPTDGLAVIAETGIPMTSAEARAYGQALIAAADKLDEIQVVSA